MVETTIIIEIGIYRKTKFPTPKKQLSNTKLISKEAATTIINSQNQYLGPPNTRITYGRPKYFQYNGVGHFAAICSNNSFAYSRKNKHKIVIVSCSKNGYNVHHRYRRTEKWVTSSILRYFRYDRPNIRN